MNKNITEKQHHTAQAQTKPWEYVGGPQGKNGSLMTITFEEMIAPKNPKNLLQKKMVWSQNVERQLGRLLDDFLGKAREHISKFDSQNHPSIPNKIGASEAGIPDLIQIGMFNYAYLLKARYEAAMTRDPTKIEFLENCLNNIDIDRLKLWNGIKNFIECSFWDTKFDFPVTDSGFFYFLIENASDKLAMGIPITENRVFVIKAKGALVSKEERWHKMGIYSAGTLCNRKLIISPKYAAETQTRMQGEIAVAEFTSMRMWSTWCLWKYHRLRVKSHTIIVELDYLMAPLIPTDQEMMDLFCMNKYKQEWIKLANDGLISKNDLSEIWEKKHFEKLFCDF